MTDKCFGFLRVALFILVAAQSGKTAEFAFTNPPVRLPAPINVNLGAGNADPTVSPDGLELVFTSVRPGTSGVSDLWVSRRSNKTTDQWSEPERLNNDINTRSAERWARFSRDGLELYFTRAPSLISATERNIWVSRRESLQSPWQAASPVSINHPDWSDQTGSLSSNGLEFWFTSNRPKPCECVGFFVAERASKDASWETPEFKPLLSEFPEGTGVVAPSLSSDGLALFFSADLPGGIPSNGSNFGADDIWIATRQSKDEPFENPRSLLSPINSDSGDHWPYLSADDSTLYFYSKRGPGGNDIWQVNVAVPEPTCSTLLGVAIALMTLSRQRTLRQSYRTRQLSHV